MRRMSHSQTLNNSQRSVTTFNTQRTESSPDRTQKATMTKRNWIGDRRRGRDHSLRAAASSSSTLRKLSPVSETVAIGSSSAESTPSTVDPAVSGTPRFALERRGISESDRLLNHVFHLDDQLSNLIKILSARASTTDAPNHLPAAAHETQRCKQATHCPRTSSASRR